MYTCMAAVLFMFAAAGMAPNDAYAAEVSLQLTVDGINLREGRIVIAVFADAKSYNNEGKMVGKAAVKADGGAITVFFTKLESGPCAIKIYHDVNENGALDSNLLGLPIEPFGFSNGAPAHFGSPDFDKAKFTLLEGINSHHITLINTGG